MMQISDFKVTGSAPPASVPMPSASTAPPTLPASMVEQTDPSRAGPAVAEPAAATSTAPAVTEAQPTAAEVLDAATTPAEPAPAEPEKPTKIDPRFSALARKEAQLFREREAMKAQKAALEEAHRQVVAFEEARQTAKTNPLAALDALGLSYEEITQHLLNGNTPTPAAEVAAVRQELEQLRAEQREAQERAEKAAQDRLAQEQAQIIESFRASAIEHVATNADRYELTTVNNAAHLVPQVIEEHFAKTKQLLTVAQGAELVEKHFERLADQVAKTRKFQARNASTNTAPTTAPAAPAATAPAPAARTLSNAMTASATATAPKFRTDEDRIRAALARLEGR